MKRGIVLADDFHPPEEVILTDCVLEVLSAKHNEQDFEAWNSCREELRGIFGPDNPWPFDVSSLAKNLQDLEDHHREFHEREAFTYSLLDPSREKCLGCLYLRPSESERFDIHVDFWFRSSHKALEAPFFSWLKNWLTETWGFQKIAFPGREVSWSEYKSHSMSFVLSTERTRLRLFTMADLPHLIQLMTDDEVMRFTSFRQAQSPEKVESCLRKWIAESDLNLGNWAAVSRERGAFLGFFMLRPTFCEDPELGFMLPKKVWGQGYATEVGRELLDHAFHRLAKHRVVAVTDRENAPSIRVLKKLSMIESALSKGCADLEESLCFEALKA